MTTYFVSRHPGAVQWAAAQGLDGATLVAHFVPSIVEPGDFVIGSLPVNLVAQVCDRGGRYLHLSLDLPPQARGRELSAEEMTEFGARIEEYVAYSPK